MLLVKYVVVPYVRGMSVLSSPVLVIVQSVRGHGLITSDEEKALVVLNRVISLLLRRCDELQAAAEKADERAADVGARLKLNSTQKIIFIHVCRCDELQAAAERADERAADMEARAAEAEVKMNETREALLEEGAAIRMQMQELRVGKNKCVGGCLRFMVVWVWV